MERLTISAGIFGDEEFFVLRDSQKYKVAYYDKGEEKYRYNIQLIINRLGLVEDALEIYKNALVLMAKSWCIMDNPNEPEEVVKKFIKRAEENINKEVTTWDIFIW